MVPRIDIDAQWGKCFKSAKNLNKQKRRDSYEEWKTGRLQKSFNLVSEKWYRVFAAVSFCHLEIGHVIAGQFSWLEFLIVSQVLLSET